MMVARDGVEPPTPAFSGLNNLSDFRWPPKYLKSRERRARTNGIDRGKFNRPTAFLVIVNDAIDPAAYRIASHQPSAGFNNLDTAAMSIMPGSSQTS